MKYYVHGGGNKISEMENDRITNENKFIKSRVWVIFSIIEIFIWFLCG